MYVLYVCCPYPIFAINFRNLPRRSPAETYLTSVGVEMRLSGAQCTPQLDESTCCATITTTTANKNATVGQRLDFRLDILRRLKLEQLLRSISIMKQRIQINF